MRIKKGNISIIIFLAIIGLFSLVSAEDEVSKKIGYEAVYVYQEVKTLDKEERTITLLSYDYQKDEEISVLYHIKEDAELEGVMDLGGIRPGDWVDLRYYIDEDGRKIADFIALETEPVFEEEGENN